ncbi:MAG: YfhO family protein [Bacteroidetes bacterium]|nr:YfhO family protein [Bacteroidota bacterium]MCL5024917.1 YfhO family protein [Chloroflexota bacterium]
MDGQQWLATRLGHALPDAPSMPLGSRARAAIVEVAPLFVLWSAVLAFFWPLITPDVTARSYIAAGDFTHQAYPFHVYTARELAAGRFPLWNPHIYAGHPFQADPQTAVFYPLGLLVSLVAGRQGLPFLALEWQVVGDFLLAATFTYLLVHTLARSRLAGVVGGLAFTMGGFLTSYPVQQLPILETAIWLPLALYAIERGCRSRGRTAWHAAAGVALGVALLAGHPQTWLLAFYASLAYFAYRAWGARLELRRAALGLAGLLGFAAGIAAVQLLPTAEFLSLSNREPLAYHVAGHGYDYASLLNTFLPLWRTERGPYIGILALSVALLAMRARGRSAGFWAGLGLLALVMSLGDRTPLFTALYRFVPGFALFKDQERAIYLFSLAGAVLAGYGAAALFAGKSLSTRWALAAALGVLAGAAAMAALMEPIGRGSPDARNLFTVYAFFLPLALVSIALLWWRPASPWRGLQGAALVLLAGIDLFVVNGQNNLDAHPPDLSPATVAAAAALPQAGQPYRVRAGDQVVFAPNEAILLGIQNPAGDSPMVSRWILPLLASEQEWRLWQLFNVQYILTRSELGAGTERVGQEGDLNTYRMAYPLPRAWVVRDVRAIEDDAAALEAVLARQFNPAKTAVLEREPGLAVTGPDGPRDQQVRWLEYGPQRLDLEAMTTDDGILVLSEAYYPGWQATLDGRPVDIYRADLAFRAVELPAGTHRLVMSYDPLSFRLGLLATGLSLGAFLVLLITTAPGLGRGSRRER